MLIAEFIFLLIMLYAGSRFGGMGLGVVSGIGLVIEVFILRMPPASAPVDVMLIIIAVVSCAAILEAAGGLKYMLQIAQKKSKKNYFFWTASYLYSILNVRYRSCCLYYHADYW